MREVGFGSGVVWSRGHDDCFVALFLLSTSKLSHRSPTLPLGLQWRQGYEADRDDQSFLSSSVSSGLWLQRRSGEARISERWVPSALATWRVAPLLTAPFQQLIMAPSSPPLFWPWQTIFSSYSFPLPILLRSFLLNQLHALSLETNNTKPHIHKTMESNLCWL